MHARHFQEPKDNIIWTKHQEEVTSTQECGKTNVCPNYIKEANQHTIALIVQQVN